MAHIHPSDPPAAPRTLVETCRQRAQDDPARLGYQFLSDGDESAAELSFGELDLQARAIAAELSRHAEPGARALLHYPPGLEFVTAFFGCLYAGIVAIPAAPLDGSRPDSAAAARSRAIVESSRPQLWLSVAEGHERIDATLREAAGLATLRSIATDGVDPAGAGRWSAPAIDAASVAYLQYSSGSTGTPKGVTLTHGNVLHNLAAIRDLCATGPAPVGALWLPMFHDMGLVAGALMPVTGARVKLMSPLAFVHQPYRWLSLLDESGSVSAAPNFAFELCTHRVTDKQLAQLDLSGWSCAIVGAERVRPATLERFAERFAACGFKREAFAPCYGLAESTLLVTGGPLGRPPTVRHLDLSALARHEVSETPAGSQSVPLVGCGEPRPGVRVVIVDPDTLRPCSPGRIGEVCVASPSVGTGYWDAPDQTQESFGLTIDGTEGSFLRTGDLGALVDGQLFVSGRRKDLIIVDGQNHYPPDLEATVEGAHPAVRTGFCAVVAVEDGRSERIVVLAELSVRALRRHGVDPDQVATAIRRAISSGHPVAVDDVVLLRPGTLPFTSSGKLQRFACAAAYAAGRLEHRRIQAAPEREAA
jgi:acyl-CoA synthetase (AMP-forming)/AMP-acid ligase II